MSVFSAEIDRVVALVKQHGSVYDRPFYLCVGEPRAGKSTVLKSMGLEWAQPATIDGQYCQYWIAKEGIFIEAREPLCGPSRNPELVRELCAELVRVRPREPLDGILLVVSATDVAERQDEALERFAQDQRGYLVEPCRVLEGDVPAYVVVNRYDTLWGFAEVFGWSAERAKEEPWGFLIPADVPSQEAWPKVEEGIQGLVARVEATCLQKLSSDAGVEQRVRAYQHLVEARYFLERLRDTMKILAFSSAYERAPWLRSVIVGCSVPGVGDRIRAGMARFANMGLSQNPYDPHRSPRPGGLPLHAFVKGIVLPEKELVPLKTRWRDDLVTVIGLVLGVLMLIAGVVGVLATGG
jgi:type VI secretion system protein ImpL